MSRRLLLLVSASIAFAAQASAATPGFDCGEATSAVEKTICADDGLAALDREVALLFAKTQKGLPAANAREQSAAQRAWLARRNDCGKEKDVHACISSAYHRRIAELQILLGEIEPTARVALACRPGSPKPIAAAFYPTDPPSLFLDDGRKHVVAFVALSGSGARYTADGVEYWEHQGEARLRWRGRDLKCAIRQPTPKPAS